MNPTALIPRLRALPIGRRTGLANPFAPSTDAPASKVGGNPVDLLRASIKTPPFARVVSGRKPLAAKPAGAFERAYEGKPIPSVQHARGWRDRLITEHGDRIARLRLAPMVTLGKGGSGWDWIREGRRIKPTHPSGLRGVVASVRAPLEVGTMAQQQEVPVSTLERLAEGGTVAEIAPPAHQPEGVSTTPALTANAGETQQSEAFHWFYLVGAVALVWVLMRGKQ